MNTHICQAEHCGTGGMRAFYSKLHVLPTSQNGDELLVRSHIAYWSGHREAEAAIIKPLRGYSYRVKTETRETVVKVVDEYDHRDGMIWIADEDDGATSVTNDAEAVVAQVFVTHGDRRIVYRDSMGQWDELVHQHGLFKSFAPGNGKLDPPSPPTLCTELQP